MQSRAKKYGHSCLICRRRKVRCDGGKPKCANCIRIGERCTYDEHGSTTTRLQNALSKAERRLENLAQNLHGLLSLGPTQCQEQLRSIVARLHHEDLDVGVQSPKEVTLASPNGTHTARHTSSLSFDNHSGPQHDGRISDDEHDEEVGHSAVSVLARLIRIRNTARPRDFRSRRISLLQHNYYHSIDRVLNKSNTTNDGWCPMHASTILSSR